MLSVNNLSLSFSEADIFKDISFELKENTVTLLSGKSGSGKSSVLMSIARIIPNIIEGNLSGEILYRGKDISNSEIKDISGSIAYMFQDAESQLCTFTVEDEIIFGLENMNIDPKNMDTLVDEVLCKLNISHLRKRKIMHLSGGEKQKVALASILAIDPEVILMDEPTANLDPESTYEMVELIRKLRDEEKKTILIVEHKIEEFKEIIDEVVLIEERGKCEKDKYSFFNRYIENTNLEKRLSKNIKYEKKVLTIKKLSFGYDKREDTIKGIDLDLNQGEILGIAGSNGAGKSTLSKLIMGLLRPTKGSISVFERDLIDLTPREIGSFMGLAFQNPEHQFIKMDVWSELSLSLKGSGKSINQVEDEVCKFLKIFDLDDCKALNPFSLSQGQKRRLSTASMMINGQKVLILDEPTYGQDAENIQKLVKLLYDVNYNGVSIIIITHDMNMIEKCCDRIIYLEKGEIVFEGEPTKLIEFKRERTEQLERL